MRTQANQILDILFSHRRMLCSAQCGGECSACRLPHIPKIEHAISHHLPIKMVLPAFPAKSVNPEKTLSALPDLGEVLSLQTLNALAAKIHEVHPAGVKLIICSDGRVFNDLVMVSDEEVAAYQKAIQRIIARYDLSYLSVFSLDDMYKHADFAYMRKHLMQRFGDSVENLKASIRSEEIARAQFNGVHRFVFEDQEVMRAEGVSKNRLRRASKEVAYQVILRSNAWSRLVEHVFPEAIRLSIHPQLCGSKKIGIHFINTDNPWGTPWHNVVLIENNRPRLVKRKEAEALGARLDDDHYILEEAV